MEEWKKHTACTAVLISHLRALEEQTLTEGPARGYNSRAADIIGSVLSSTTL